MIEKRTKSQASTVVLLGLIACFFCALFPPRRITNGGVTSISRVLLFIKDIDMNKYKDWDGRVGSNLAEVDAGRLFAECVLIVSVCGIVLLYIFADDG